MSKGRKTRSRSIVEELSSTSHALATAEKAYLGEAMSETRAERRGLLKRLA
jgi:hypothetical protein